MSRVGSDSSRGDPNRRAEGWAPEPPITLTTDGFTSKFFSSFVRRHVSLLAGCFCNRWSTVKQLNWLICMRITFSVRRSCGAARISGSSSWSWWLTCRWRRLLDKRWAQTMKVSAWHAGSLVNIETFQQLLHWITLYTTHSRVSAHFSVFDMQIIHDHLTTTKCCVGVTSWNISVIRYVHVSLPILSIIDVKMFKNTCCPRQYWNKFSSKL